MQPMASTTQVVDCIDLVMVGAELAVMKGDLVDLVTCCGHNQTERNEWPRETCCRWLTSRELVVQLRFSAGLVRLKEFSQD
jgi:hypothetical protein